MTISTVTSEALQLKLRQLLPSQQGFGSDLSASDTIIPIIDLTGAAEGSQVPQNLQTALAFGSQIPFSAVNSTDIMATTPGFYRIFGAGVIGQVVSGSAAQLSFTMTDGASIKTIWNMTLDASGITGSALAISESIDFTIFIAAGETISAVSDNARAFLKGSARQIADTNGNLINPNGFNPQ